jgi:putative toxin-antitoxin system antitoxin component (TIGR02293 family)
MIKYTAPDTMELHEAAVMSYRSPGKIAMARRGLYMQDVLDIAHRLSLSLSDLSPILHTSQRSLQRYAPDKVLSTDLSSIVLMLRDLHSHASDIIGEDHVAGWLREHVPALGCTPLSLLDTPFGFVQVSDTLSRIAHGIYA